jgi:Outer membrane protein beta-barrel family
LTIKKYYSNNDFKFQKGYSLNLNFWGLTKQSTGIFETNARFIVNAAVSKIFFKKWNCTLSCNNIFRNNIETEKFTINNVNSKARYLVDNHEVSVSVRYSFGDAKETGFKEKNLYENSDRVK